MNIICYDDHLLNIPLFVLLNKSDLCNAIDPQIIIDRIDLHSIQSYNETRYIKVFQISCQNDKNISQIC